MVIWVAFSVRLNFGVFLDGFLVPVIVCLVHRPRFLWVWVSAPTPPLQWPSDADPFERNMNCRCGCGLEPLQHGRSMMYIRTVSSAERG
jgi:hypothetical protein